MANLRKKKLDKKKAEERKAKLKDPKHESLKEVEDKNKLKEAQQNKLFKSKKVNHREEKTLLGKQELSKKSNSVETIVLVVANEEPCLIPLNNRQRLKSVEINSIYFDEEHSSNNSTLSRKKDNTSWIKVDLKN